MNLRKLEFGLDKVVGGSGNGIDVAKKMEEEKAKKIKEINAKLEKAYFKFDNLHFVPYKMPSIGATRADYANQMVNEFDFQTKVMLCRMEIFYLQDELKKLEGK